jgi:hypothetical protein
MSSTPTTATALTAPTATALKGVDLTTVKTWEDFVEKVAPCLNVLVDKKVSLQFMKGPSPPMLRHFSAVRHELEPLVTSLWKKAGAPAPLWPIVMAIVKIASTSDKPKTWLQGLNKHLKTSYTMTSADAASIEDDFSSLFRPLTGKEATGASSKKVEEVDEEEDEEESVSDEADEEVDAEQEGSEEEPVLVITDSRDSSPKAMKKTSPSTAALRKRLEELRIRYCKATGTKMASPPKTATAAVLKKGIAALEQALKQQSAADEDGGDWLSALGSTLKVKAGTVTGSKSKKTRMSLGSTTSDGLGGEEDDLGNDEGGWGTTSIDPSRFKPFLSRLIKSTAPTIKYVDGGPADGFVGLCFIEHVTNSGGRSLVSWLKDLEESLRESNPLALKQREVYELRYQVFLAQLHVQDAGCVQAAVSGSNKVLDTIGRRLFALNQVVVGDMSWSAAEEFLPAGAVKRHSMGVPSKHLTGMAKAMRRAAKAAVILKEGPGAVGKEKNKKSE